MIFFLTHDVRFYLRHTSIWRPSGTRSTYVHRLTHISFCSDVPGDYMGLCSRNWLRVGLFRRRLTGRRLRVGTLGRRSAWRMIAQRRIEQRCGANASSHTSASYYNNDDIALMRPLAHPNAVPLYRDDDVEIPEGLPGAM